MNTSSRHLATCTFTFVCTLFLLPTVLLAQVKTPTHPHVSYGPEDRQWLNLYLPSGNEPAPVFLYAHHNGSTADDVKSSWAKPTLAEGTAIVSWESIAKVQGLSDFQVSVADAKVMFAWVKKNAATYNFDIDKIFIGGQSRGSFVSWELAHSGDPAIVGIYMGQALPGRSFNERLLEPITKNAPPIFLAYRKEPGAVGDIHDAAHGLRVLEKYKELVIGVESEGRVDGRYFNENGGLKISIRVNTPLQLVTSQNVQKAAVIKSLNPIRSLLISMLTTLPTL